MINFLRKIFQQSDDNLHAEDEKKLLNYEAEVGGKLFGPLPKGHKRQFFCLDENTWIWHEEWTEKDDLKAVTTRYNIRPGAVIKIQDGQPQQPVSLTEASNLLRAIQLYWRHIDKAYQQLLAG